MSARDQARRLARKKGCELEYWRARSSKHVHIWLPSGMQMVGNPGLDVLHHECELDEDIWLGVIDELEALELEEYQP